MTLRSWLSKWFRSRKTRTLTNGRRSARKSGLWPSVEALEDRTAPALLLPSQVLHAYGVDQLPYGGGTGSGATVNITSLAGSGLGAVSLDAVGSNYPDSASIELSVTGGGGANGVVVANTNATGHVSSLGAIVQVGSGYGTTVGAATTPAGLGAGETIGIIEAGDDVGLVNTGNGNFDISDLYNFDHNVADIPDPPSFQVVGELGTSASRPVTIGNEADDETALDVEWAHSFAPSANIVDIEANNFSYADVGTALEVGIPTVDASLEAQGLNPISTFSISYGFAEFSAENGPSALSFGISNAMASGGVATISWPFASNAAVDNTVTISGFTGSSAGFNGTYPITSTGAGTFSYTDNNANLTTISGAGTAALDIMGDGAFSNPGVSFAVSTGDNGIPPLYPAISPNVLGVGATNLFLNANGSYNSETAWSDPADITSISGAALGTITVTTATETGVAAGQYFAIENSAQTVGGIYGPVLQVLSPTEFTYVDNLDYGSSFWAGGYIGVLGHNAGGSTGGVSADEPQPSYQQGPIAQAAVNQTISASPTAISEFGNTVTVTTTTAPEFLVGANVTISGVTGPYAEFYDGTFEVVSENSTSFTFFDSLSPLDDASGGTATQGALTQVAPGQSISGAVESSNTVTITLNALPNFIADNSVAISGYTGAAAGYNGVFEVTDVNMAADTITYTDGISGLAPAGSGTAALVSDSRTNPDVAMIGGSLSYVETYDSEGSPGPYSSADVGGAAGTSLSAPCWAGLIADINQGRSIQGLSALQTSTIDGASLQTVLYDLPSSDYHEINDGFNGYPAENGYSLLTGLGSPIANQLVPDVVNAVVYVTPDDGATHNIVVSESGGNIDVTDNGSPVASGPASTTSEIDISGGAATGTISVTLNYSGGVFDIPIHVDGGSGAGTHSLTIADSNPLTSVTYNATGVGAGNFVVNGLSADPISFTALTPTTVSAVTGTVTINVDPGNTILGLVNTTFTGSAGNDTATFDNGLESMTFANPTVALIVNGHAGPNDITFTSLDSGFNAALTVSGNAVGDTVSVNTALSLGSATSTGALAITAATIDLNGVDIATDNSPADGNVTLTGAVVLGANTTISTGTGTAAFDGTLDDSSRGTDELFIHGNASFGGVVGTTPLEFLHVYDATAIDTTSITTALEQIYDGAVTLGMANGTTASLTDATGFVTFGSTVDATTAGQQGLAISAFASSFEGVVGTTALSSLSVTGITEIDTTSITTSNTAGGSGNQAYGAAILGTANGTTVSLTATGGTVTFNNTVVATTAGQQGLAITGNTSFAGVVGATALRSLSVSGTTAIGNTAITTSTAGGGTGDQTYTGAVTLNSTTALNTNTLTAGTMNLGDNLLEIDNSGAAFINGVIGGLGGNLDMVGSATLTLTNSNSYSGGTDVGGGTLLVDNTTGSGTGSGNVFVIGGTLGGTGAISGAVSVSIGAVQPGDAPGTLTTGQLSFGSGSDFNVGIAGNSVDNYSQDDVTSGTVTLGGATLNLTADSYTPHSGDHYVIIDNNGGSSVSGTFDAGLGCDATAGTPLADGAIISTNFLSSGLTATIHYASGGNGQSVEIDVGSPPTNDYGVSLNNGALSITQLRAADNDDLQFSLAGGTYTFTDAGGNGYTFATPTGNEAADVSGGGTGSIQISPSSAVTSIVVTLGTGTNSFTFESFDAAIAPISVNTGSGTGLDEININAPVSVNGAITLTSTSIGVEHSLTASGTIDLYGNAGTPVAGNFVGVDVNGSTLQSTGGNVLLEGTGGNNAAGDQAGVLIRNGATVEATGAAGTVTIQGTGGDGSASVNDGVYMSGTSSMVTSGGGAVSVTGSGGGAASGSHELGIDLEGGVVTAGGTGTVTLMGTGGAISGGNDWGIFLNNSVSVTSNGGNVSLTGIGGGAGASGANLGILFNGSAEVSAGGLGSVNLNGTGGDTTGGSDFGVDLNPSSGTTSITSSGGNVSVTGNGGGAGAGAQNEGILFNRVARVSAGGLGTVTLVGTGGDSTGGTNIGINFNGTSGTTAVTSNGGNVSVTGTGGSAATGGADSGVDVGAGETVTAGGSGTVTVMGTAGTSSGATNLGVAVYDGATITSGGGDISVTGLGGGSGANEIGIDVEDAGAITATGLATLTLTGTGANAAAAISTAGVLTSVVGTLATGAGNLTLTGDIIDLGAAGTVATTSGQLLFQPQTAGRPIILGSTDTAGSLVFTAADVNALRSGFSLLTIGNASSGDITVGSSVFLASSTNTQLTSGGNILISDGQFNTDGGTLMLTPGTGTIQPTEAGIDATASSVTLNGALGINIAGTTVDTQYAQLKVSGTVALNSQPLELTGGFTPSPGDVFTIVSATGVGGTFSNVPTNFVTFNGQTLQVNYNDIGGTVTLTDVGAAPAYEESLDVSGNLSITQNPAFLAANDNLSVALAGGNYTFSDSNGLTFDTPAGAGSGFISGAGTSTISISSAHVSSITVDLTAGIGTNIVTLAGTGGSSAAPISVNTGSTTGDNLTISGAVADSGAVSLTSASIDVNAGLSAAGDVDLYANTAGTATGNFAGILVNGASASVESSAGSVLLQGTGGDDSGGFQYGIEITNGGVVQTTGGTGAVALDGTGGASTGTLNAGVDVDFGSLVTSFGGAVMLTGQGGGSGGSTYANYGVFIGAATVEVQNTPLTIDGTAGAGISFGHGVILYEEADANVLSTGSGSIAINATGDGTTVDFYGAADSTFTHTVGGPSDTGPISITANGVDLDELPGLVNIQTTGTVSFLERTAGTPINIGGSDVYGATPTLGLSSTELDDVNAGTLAIGDANSGDITVSAAITLASSTNTQLTSGGSILISGGQFNTDGGTLTLTPGTGSIQPTVAGIDATASTATLDGPLGINIAGTTVDTQYAQLNVSGTVDLNSQTLDLTGGFIPAAGNVFTIVSATSVTSTFENLPANGDTIVFNGVTLEVNYTGTTVTLSDLATSTAVTSSQGSSDSAVYGTSVTFTATVTSGGTPVNGVGSVQFYIDGVADGSAVNINASGVAVSPAISTLDVAGSPYAITADYTDSSGPYGPSNGTLAGGESVTPLALSVTGITANNKPYDGGTTATLNTGSAVLHGVVSGDTGITLDVSVATGTFASRDVANGIPVQVANITFGGLTQDGTPASQDYTLTQPTTTANIGQATLTVSGITANNKPYDGGTTATLNTGSAVLHGVVSGDATPPGPGTVALVIGTPTGTFASPDANTGITVQVAGLTLSGATADGTPASTDYTLTQPTTAANITKVTLTVTGITANNKPYDGGTAATLNTGSAVLHGVVSGDATPPGPGTVALVIGTPTGTFASPDVNTGITVQVAGLTVSGATADGTSASTDYTLTQPTTAANITKATLTVTGITAANKPYDGTTTATINTSGATPHGVAAGDTGITFNYSGATGTFASPNVGTGIAVQIAGITFGGTTQDHTAASVDYTLTQPATTANITARTLTYTANAVSITYGMAIPPLSGTLTGFIAGQNQGNATTGTLGFTTPATQTSPVGSYAIDGSGLTANNGNYVFVQAPANATALRIGKAALTVSANSLSKVYGAPVPTLTGPLTGVVNGDNITVVFTTTATASSDVKPGGYPIIANLIDPNGRLVNYTVTNTPGVLTITQAPQTITWNNPANIVYGTTLGHTQLNATVSVVGPALAGALTYTPIAGTTLNAGSGQSLQVSAAATTDYSPATKTVSINVTAAPLTITANNDSKTYNTIKTFLPTAYTEIGLVNGDTITGVTETSTGAPAAANAGSYSIVPSAATGAGLGNYAITYVNGKLTVNPAPLTVTLSGLTATANGSQHPVSATAAGYTGAFTITYNGLTTAPSAAGTYAVVATPQNTNYVDAAGTGTGTLTIAPPPPAGTATVTLGNLSQTYGNPLPVTATTNPAGLTVTFTYASSTYPSSAMPPTHAGSYTVTATVAPNQNYTGAARGTLVIAQAMPVITWILPNNATIPAGSALSAAYLDAAASVAGSFVYTPGLGAKLAKGANTLSVTFTPADADYLTVTMTVVLTAV